MKVDPAWAHRRLLLLRGGEQLSPKALARLKTVMRTDDPTGELRAAWACKELLRQLLAAHRPTRYSRHETAHHRTRFLTACATANMPETTRLAGTILKWSPEIEAFLELRRYQRPTRGLQSRHQADQAGRVCGFRTKTTTKGASCCIARPSGPREPPTIKIHEQHLAQMRPGAYRCRSRRTAERRPAIRVGLASLARRHGAQAV